MFSILYFLITTLSFFSTDSLSQTTNYTLTLQNGMGKPDGYQKEIVLVNGQFPGPLIEVCPGDFMEVTVQNLMNVGASVHFHGLHAKGYPEYDGVAFGTQWPISPGNNFTYIQQITQPPGTYWYHAHYQMQSESIYGPLIIKDPYDTFPAQNRLILMLSDWFHASQQEQMAGLMASPFQWIGDPQSILLNGKGSFCTLLNQACLTNSTMEIFSVASDQRYRLHIIGASSLSYFGLSIEQHNLTIIEVDGLPVEPITVEQLEVNSGQRYVVELDTDQPIGSYLITVEVLWRKSGPLGYGYLQYNGSSLPQPNNLPLQRLVNRPTQPDWIQRQIQPKRTAWVPNQSMPQTADQIWILTGRQEKQLLNGLNYTKWTINHEIFEMEQIQTPLLLDPTQLSKYKQNPLVKELQSGQVLDIVLQNTVALNGICEQHPWHLHGHYFWEVASGPGNYSDSLNNSTGFKYKTPIRRDSTTLFPFSSSFSQQPNFTFNGHQTQQNTQPAGSACGWKLIRVVGDNPGLWNLHCHINAHMNMGMMVFLLEDLNDLTLLLRNASGFGSDFGRGPVSTALLSKPSLFLTAVWLWLIVLFD